MQEDIFGPYYISTNMKFIRFSKLYKIEQTQGRPSLERASDGGETLDACIVYGIWLVRVGYLTRL